MSNSNPAYDSKTLTGTTPVVRPFVVELFRHTPLYLFATGLMGALRSRRR